MFLEVNNLNKSYKTYGKNKLLVEELSIFKDLNFSVNNENIITIYGPSGIGKTTFLNILGTVDRPDTGSVYLKNIEYSEKTYHKLRRDYIGYIFQFHYLLPEFTIYENLDIILSIKGLKEDSSKDMILSYLEKFNIVDKAAKYPSYLSGGERQRIAIARCMYVNPQLIIFDEATSALDFNSNCSILLFVN